MRQRDHATTRQRLYTKKTAICLVHIVVLRVALVELQVGKRGGLNANVEGPAAVSTERNPCERHLPAVQVARNGNRGHRHLACREVVARGDGNHRLGRQLDATIQTERLRDILAVARSTVVEGLRRVVDTIIETEVPRYREVVVCAGHPLSSHRRVERAVGV